MLVFAMFTSAMLGIVQVGSWLGGWVSGWVDEWVSGWVGEWVSGWVDEWVDEWVGLLLRQDILMCAKIIDLLFCLHNTRRWRLEHMGSIPENQCSTWWVCVHVCGGGGEFYMVSVDTCVWGRGRTWRMYVWGALTNDIIYPILPAPSTTARISAPWFGHLEQNSHFLCIR